ncbi:MAG: pitrilysin family protein [Pyrinomonadaceae bacterium]
MFMIQRKFFNVCLTFSFVVALSCANVFAQEAKTENKSALALTAPTTFSNSIADKAAQSAALVSEFEVNGLKVLVKRRDASQTVSVGLFLRGGARNVTEQNAGIETLMLDAATEASANFPRERLRVEQARLATGVGASANYDYSVLSLRCTRPNFERSWDMFADIALHPTFASEDVARVKSRLITALQGENDDPDSYLQALQNRTAYIGHPYRNRPQGTVEILSRLTPEDLRRYHAQMLQTSRLLLVVVGDLDPNQVRRLVENSFGKLPRGNYTPQPAPPLEFKTASIDITPIKLPTNYVQGIFAAPSLTNPDIYAMRVASSILRDRVFSEVRVKRNLSYAPNAFLGSQGANVGGIYVTAVDANQAVGLMLGEITRLQNEPIEASDVSAIVAEYLTTYYLGEETNAAQAGELARYELIGGGWRNSTTYIEHLRAVTPSDVQRVAKTYMRNIRFVVLGDPKQIDKNLFVGKVSE